MSSFNLPNLSEVSSWNRSNSEDKGSLESQWHQQSFLQLKELSNQPFDILEAIQSNEADNLAITESDEPSVDSMHSFSEKQTEQGQQQDDLWTQPDQKSKLFTLSWETKRDHFPTPIQVEMADYTIPFLTESTTGAFEPLLTSPTHFAIKQDALVKGLLQAIAGLPSVYFNWSVTERRFKSRVSFRILDVSNAATEPIIEHLLSFGTRLKHLDGVANQCTSNP
ncbi:hypothetical protein K501DRAFT_223764, partial [Backusella circina FSU 941]